MEIGNRNLEIEIWNGGFRLPYTLGCTMGTRIWPHPFFKHVTRMYSYNKHDPHSLTSSSILSFISQKMQPN